MLINVSVATNRVGSKISETIEIDDAELAELSEEERDKHIAEVARDWVFNNIEWYWEIAE